MTPTHDNDHVSADEIARALDPAIGTGTPDTAPWEDPTVSLLRREPVLLLALVLLLPAAGTAIEAWAAGRTATAIVASAVGVLIATLTPIVRAAVTPIARPRLDHETPLAVAPPAA